MAQHGIAISEHSFQILMAMKAKMHEQGSMFSNSRLVNYLVDFREKVFEAYAKAVNSNEPDKEKLGYLIQEIGNWLNHKPPELPRGGYRPSRNASMEKRMAVTQQLLDRLGIDNPPRELVNFYLDNPEQMNMRAVVLAQQARKNEVENLKMGFPPDTPTKP